MSVTTAQECQQVSLTANASEIGTFGPWRELS